MRLIPYVHGFEQRFVRLDGEHYTVQDQFGQVISRGKVAHGPKTDHELLRALHQQDEALRIPEGVQVWQVHDIQRFASLQDAQQAAFPAEYELVGVVPVGSLDEAYKRAQHGLCITELGMQEDGKDWRERPGVWKRPGRAVSSSAGDVYVLRGKAWRVLGVGFAPLGSQGGPYQPVTIGAEHLVSGPNGHWRWSDFFSEASPVSDALTAEVLSIIFNLGFSAGRNAS